MGGDTPAAIELRARVRAELEHLAGARRHSWGDHPTWDSSLVLGLAFLAVGKPLPVPTSDAPTADYAKFPAALAGAETRFIYTGYWRTPPSEWQAYWHPGLVSPREGLDILADEVIAALETDEAAGMLIDAGSRVGDQAIALRGVRLPVSDRFGAHRLSFEFMGMHNDCVYAFGPRR